MTHVDQIVAGDVMESLRTLPDGIAQCCVTSPPYWNLRDYNAEGQLGLEATPEEYVEKMVEVFREVRRVLRDDGTLWLNMGDSYANDTKWGGSTGGKHVAGLHGNTRIGRAKVKTGLKAKDLVGMPWRLAFALQADGWWLRSDIVWNKPNAMPESVRDRPTKAHEYIFLLSKKVKYYYDQKAISEPAVKAGRILHSYGTGAKDRMDITDTNDRRTRIGLANWNQPVPDTRNMRDVWTIPTQPFPNAHFATFPEALVSRCIRAGTSEKGACSECGAPWRRVVERVSFGKSESDTKFDDTMQGGPLSRSRQAYRKHGLEGPPLPRTTGWEPTCRCGHENTRPCLTVDPFSRSGTVAAVARTLGRSYWGCDLNPDYVAMALRRVGRPALGPSETEDLPLFDQGDGQ